MGGNPNLIAESGETFTAGGVWNTGFGNSGLTVTADYWKTELEDGISSLGVQFILDDCYINENASSCALITRTFDYDIFTVIDGTLNVATQGAEGVDLEVRYDISTDVGELKPQYLDARSWAHQDALCGCSGRGSRRHVYKRDWRGWRCIPDGQDKSFGPMGSRQHLGRLAG